MSLGSINDILQRVGVLREVDSVIDLTRGWLQFRILIALGFLGSSDPDGLAKLLGERKKAVLDALRKLKLKDLITDVEGGRYVSLSESGKELYNMVVGLVSGDSVRGRGGLRFPISEDIHRDLAKSIYLYDVIVALGTSRKHELSLNTLASIVKLSPEVLDDYVKPYAEGDLKLFKRYSASGKLFSRGKKLVYRLSDEGLKVYHRLPDYVKYRNDWKASILRRLTRSGHPRIVLKRISLILSLGSAFIALTAVLLPPYLSLIMVLTWVLIISFVALITEMTF
ncbi:MAG: hypothetical protein NZ911_06150 [Sulfolobales archaeon]|nr:hypothetical protein [Sulfolobales archaeon]